MEIHIKNMVCDRCVRAVTAIFNRNAIPPVAVRLGVVEIEDDVALEKTGVIRNQLEEEGFEWMDDQKAKLVEEVKQAILQLVRGDELDEKKENLSQYLSRLFNRDYHYLSALFSSLENTTIEQYFILQKTEKVKEWLAYGELSLSEMAFRLGYSSVAHLSGQFKKVTGFTPSQFKQLKDHRRKPLDKL